MIRSPAASLILICAAGASAQPVSVGVVGGVPLTPSLEGSSGYRAITRRYTVGPGIELRLPRRFAVSLDALYKRLAYDFRNDPTRAGRWEFPLLVKYRTGEKKVTPFGGAGIAWNRVTGPNDRPFLELRHRSALGVTAAAGVETRWRRLRIAPEIRYTHWGERNFGVRGASLRSNLDQVDLLLGLRF